MRPLFQVPKLAFFDFGGIQAHASPPETPEFDHAASVITTRWTTSRRRTPPARRGVAVRRRPAT